MDRHVIANMGAEPGATTTVFPADDADGRPVRCAGRQSQTVALRGVALDHRMRTGGRRRSHHVAELAQNELTVEIDGFHVRC
jgi:aconitase A